MARPTHKPRLSARYEEQYCGDDAVLAPEDNLSAVQYVRFAFSPEARVAFRGEHQEAKIVINPPRYQAQTVFSPETVTL